MKKSSFGSIQKGILTTDCDQIKIHYKSLSRLDIANLRNVLRNTLAMMPSQKFEYSSHVNDKVRNKEVSLESEIIQSTLDVFLSNSDGSSNCLIEYNEKSENNKIRYRRILLRSLVTKLVDIKDNGEIKCNYCFVINIDTGRVVTVYWNKASDSHDSLDESIYQEPCVAKGLGIKSNIKDVGSMSGSLKTE
ncbi:hypothetical protein [Conchiformibius kuhniae]|uniref:Uncharacterized protein n=1 Tax=Conchiformibius kuhniae TaxID=211502 RepID=A0A8T9MVV8_9NEIS|nr:hypothetical protein [Conchiformibius kuhniae]UOP04548.1 hypothetical protein LVJ77_09820 [Conchiformibius kuhniae]